MKRLVIAHSCTLAVVVLWAGFASPQVVARAKSGVRANKQRYKRSRRLHRKRRPPQYYQARRVFIEGVRLFDEGSYNKAIGKFKEALRIFDNPRVHARIALCYRWLGNNLMALEHYEKFLRRGAASGSAPADVRLRVKVRGMVKRLLRRVSGIRVTITQPPGAEIRINGRLVGTPPFDRLIRLNHGPVNVTVIAKGHYPFRRDLKLKPGQSQVIRVTLVKHKPRIKLVHLRGRPFYRKWWFWTVVGTLVAGTAAGLGVGLGTKVTPRSPAGLPIYHDGFVRR